MPRTRTKGVAGGLPVPPTLWVKCILTSEWGQPFALPPGEAGIDGGGGSKFSYDREMLGLSATWSPHGPHEVTGTRRT